jgi:hypothetical protein
VLRAPRFLLAHRVLDRAHQALAREVGLPQEIGGAGLEALHRQILAAGLGQQDHRRRRGIVQHARHPRQAVAGVGLDVHESGGVATLAQRAFRRAALARIPFLDVGGRPARAQHAGHRAAEIAGLIHDEESHRGGVAGILA